MISKKEAIGIAKDDAESTYADLSNYKITATIKDMKWHVKYELNGDEPVNGGGPEYVISAERGEILEKKYWQ